VQVLIRINLSVECADVQETRYLCTLITLFQFAKGGTDEISNLATLCSDCNIGKSDFTFTDYQNMSLIPEDIEKYFEFRPDDKADAISDIICIAFSAASWLSYVSGTISSFVEDYDTEFASSSDRSALEARRKNEEMIEFKK